SGVVRGRGARRRRRRCAWRGDHGWDGDHARGVVPGPAGDRSDGVAGCQDRDDRRGPSRYRQQPLIATKRDERRPDMVNARALAIWTLALAVVPHGIQGQTRASYRNFALGSNVATIAEQA